MHYKQSISSLLVVELVWPLICNESHTILATRKPAGSFRFGAELLPDDDSDASCKHKHDKIYDKPQDGHSRYFRSKTINR